jgi:hypothetical protein
MPLVDRWRRLGFWEGVELTGEKVQFEGDEQERDRTTGLRLVWRERRNCR